MRFGCETMANEARSVSQYRKAKEKRQRRVKHQQRERTEPIRGLSKDEKESPADSPLTNQ